MYLDIILTCIFIYIYYIYSAFIDKTYKRVISLVASRNEYPLVERLTYLFVCVLQYPFLISFWLKRIFIK